MNSYEYYENEELQREAELQEAETLIRNGGSMRQIMRKQFTYLGQSDIFKLYRKYGMDPGEDSGEMW